MRRPSIILLGLVGLAMLTTASGWTHPGRTATTSGKLFVWTGKDLGIVNADGRGAKILRKLGDVAEVELSPDHRRVGLIDRSRRLFVVTLSGTENKRLIAKHVESFSWSYTRSFSWSPDSRQIAYADWGDQSHRIRQIYVVRVDGSGRQQITHNTRAWSWKFYNNYNRLAWSPDGKRIAFINWQNYSGHGQMDGGRVFTISPSGGRERPGPRVGFTPFTISWSPDGSALAVGGNRVAIVRGSRVTKLRGSDCCLGYDAQVLAWSPDGSRVAFLGTTEPGFPDGGVAAVDGSVFTLIKHGGSPVWSPDGKRLAFVYRKLFMSDRNGHHIVAVPTTAIGSLLAWTR